VRSLVNIAGEREQDLSKIRVDLGIFKAIARGFLGSARDLTLHEIQLMVDAAQIMALELGVRFLTDYLRGDTYFRLTAADPSELNKIRALVQFTVFEHLRQNASSMKVYIDEMRAAGAGRNS
jgi:N-acetylhexosamine 1-kinase